jgi:hypothetical protein
MVIAHAAIVFWHHFHPWTIKNMDLETVCHLAISTHRRFENKCVQGKSRGGLPNSIQKLIKANIWAPVCPLGVPAEPRITKMVSWAHKKEPQSRSHKLQFLKEKAIKFRSHPVMSCLLKGGQRQGQSLNISGVAQSLPSC